MMASSEYWKRREETALQKYITDEVEYNKRLNEIYTNMYNQCQKEIEAFYAKYADKEGIRMATAKRRVDKLDMEAYSKKAKKYVAEKNLSKKANTEMRLYNLTMKVNRLELLKAEMGMHLVDSTQDLETYIQEKLEGRTKEELQRQAGILGDSVKNADSLAVSIVNASFHNATFSERIWANQDLLKAEINKQLQSGLIAGKHPTVLARELRKVFDTNRYNSERLMRTELARVQIDAQMRSYTANGYDMYQYITVGATACNICKELDGKKFKVVDMLAGTNAPPMHPNCRCSTAAAVDEEEYQKWLDSKSGKKETREISAIGNAKSIKDAENQAAKYFREKLGDKTFKGKASYKGISLEHANQINETLDELTRAFPEIEKLSGIKTVDPMTAKGKKIFTSQDAVMAYDPINHGVYVNRNVLKDADSLATYNMRSQEAWNTVMNNIEMLSGAQKKTALQYKNAGRSLVGNGSIRDYLTHEYGHHVAYTSIDVPTVNSIGENWKHYAPNLSGYANSSKSEYLAESFVAYRNGEIKKIDPEYTTVIKKLGENEGASSKTNLDMVDYGTKNIPTLYVMKKEYAKVIHELNTNLTPEELQQPVLFKAIGNYVYTIEISGYNNYRIIGRKEID